MQNKKGYFKMFPFADYARERAEFERAFPNAVIEEEIKSLQMAAVESPRIPGLQMPAGPQLVPMMMWGVVYTEKEEIKLN